MMDELTSNALESQNPAKLVMGRGLKIKLQAS